LIELWFLTKVTHWPFSNVKFNGKQIHVVLQAHTKMQTFVLIDATQHSAELYRKVRGFTRHIEIWLCSRALWFLPGYCINVLLRTPLVHTKLTSLIYSLAGKILLRTLYSKCTKNIYTTSVDDVVRLRTEYFCWV